MNTILKKIGLFSTLDEESLDKLSQIIVEREYKKGSNIFIEGEKAKAVYIIKQGKVKIYKTAQDGKEHIIHIMGDGEVFAEACIFDVCPYPASADAVENTIVYVINNRDLEAILERNPKIAIELVKVMARRLRMVAMQIENLSLKDAYQKTAALIVQLFKIHNKEIKSGSRMKLEISRTDMANMVGLTRETLTRALFRLKDEGIIDIDGKDIIILDYEILEEIYK